MNLIKRLLFKTLGLEKYLTVIRNVFFISYKNGWLRNKEEYFCHYNAKKLINPGDTVIDIGANLGYYSRIFANQCGENGKVYAVEPVLLFRSILQKTIKRYPNVTVIPYALGKEDGVTIKMGLPWNKKYLSHGRTKVIEADNQNIKYHFEAEMRSPMSIFNQLDKIDYIKCDIEGYERIVIPEFMPIIEKFNPIIQIETEGENRDFILEMLQKIGYKVYYSEKTQLVAYNHTAPPAFSGDLIFIHESEN